MSTEPLEKHGAIPGLRHSQFEDASEILKAMSNETRLKILCALSSGELPVHKLADMTGQSSSVISQHLAKLRAVKLVEARREAQTIYYRCLPGAGKVLVDSLCKYYNRGET